MFIEVLGNLPTEDPAQGLVKVETVRASNFAAVGVHYGWFVAADEGAVTLQVCKNKRGDAGDYLLHLNPAHIVAWRYADLQEV